MTSGRLWTLAVVGVYWISWISSFWKTTLPGVVPTFAADLEGRVVGHRDPALGQVLGEQLQALDQAGAAGLHGELQRLRVGRQGVRRAQRVDHLAQREAPLGLAALVERRGVQRLVHQVASGPGRCGRPPRSAGPWSRPPPRTAGP